jgi:hypothetical protein
MKINIAILGMAVLLMFGCVSRHTSDVTTKTYTLRSWGNGAPRLQIDTPPSFRMRRLEGPDFEVFYFSEAATKSTMGIYVGHHPSLGSSQASKTDVQRQPGRVGDSSVEWLRRSLDGQHESEALVRDFYGQSARQEYAGLILHVFNSAATEQDVARMEMAAATLRLERGR